jgi:predicted flavoprotein YhiN
LWLIDPLSCHQHWILHFHDKNCFETGTLWVDFAPSMDVNEVFETLVNRKISFPTRQLGGPAPGKFLFVRRFWHYLLQRENLDKMGLWATVPKKSLWQLATLIKRCAFLVSGKVSLS